MPTALLQRDVPLDRLNTLGLAARAAGLATITSIDRLKALRTLISRAIFTGTTCLWRWSTICGPK